MKIAFLLPGMHRVHRGAEVAFEAVATEIGRLGRDEVTVFGSGDERPDRPYEYVRAPLIPRERFERAPTFPPFRTHYVYEEATWTVAALRRYRPKSFDVTVTCSFPFTHWMATRWPPFVRDRPAHVFVTQNGDHAALTDRREYRSFRCDGLVCTNPVYFERQRDRWRSVLIPNGYDPSRFARGAEQRARLGLPAGVPIVLIVGALVPSKRVLEGLEAVAAIPDAHLVVAGDGPLRREFDALADRLMPGRARRLVLPSESMPDLYRSVDVLLHPTLFESFGNVYVEAMAVGLPVVAHDSPVTRWIFGDEPGLIDAERTEQMTNALVEALAEGSVRADERAAVARDRFTWPEIGRAYREFLAEVMARDEVGR